MRLVSGLVVLVYLLVGVLIANDHHYFTNVHGLNGVVSAILAVLLWPLILLGVNLHIGKNGNGGGKQGAIVALPWVRTVAARRRARPSPDTVVEMSTRAPGRLGRASCTVAGERLMHRRLSTVDAAERRDA